MTGLDKILQEIRDEAASEAKRTVEEARAKAARILTEAKAESDATVAKIDAAAAQDVADINAAQASSQQLQHRQRTLETKQAMLAETLQKAKESLYVLPEGDYFDLLVRLAAGASEKGEGQMLLNAKDAARLPAGFETKLAGALPAGHTLAVAKETRPIDGGFVLKYGDVEQNCSFGALFDARGEEFSDLARGVLFGEG